MIDDPDVLERLTPLFPPPDGALERCLHLRDRKRRNKRLGAIAVAAVITAALVGSLLSSSMGSRRQPADTGIITPSNVAMLEVSWTAKTAPSAIGLEGLSVANDTLYVATSDDAKLSAFPVDCAAEGRRCSASWTANIPTQIGACHPVECIGSMPAGPAVSDSLVFVGSLHRLTAFPASCSARRCRPVWVGRTNAIAHQPVVANGVVYVGTGGGFLYAFPVTCERRCKPLWVSARQPTSLQVSQVVDGVVYAETEPIWGSATQDAPRFSIGYGFPATCERGCEPIWTAPLTSLDVAAPLTVSDGTIYVVRPTGSQRSILSAYRAECGIGARCRSWSATLPATAGGSPLVVDDMVVVTIPNADEVRAYPTSCARRCEPLWSVSVPGLSDLRPVAANGLVFVGSTTNGIAAIPLDCGTTTADCLPISVSGREAAEITVADGTLFVRSANGRVSALVPPVPSTAELNASGRRSAAILYIGLLVLATVLGLILFARSRRNNFGST